MTQTEARPLVYIASWDATCNHCHKKVKGPPVVVGSPEFCAQKLCRPCARELAHEILRVVGET